MPIPNNGEWVSSVDISFSEPIDMINDWCMEYVGEYGKDWFSYCVDAQGNLRFYFRESKHSNWFYLKWK